MLLRRTMTDAGLFTYTAKDHYGRARPFVLNREPTCAPDEEEDLKKDGSYPSGHRGTAGPRPWPINRASMNSTGQDSEKIGRNGIRGRQGGVL